MVGYMSALGPPPFLRGLLQGQRETGVPSPGRITDVRTPWEILGLSGSVPSQRLYCLHILMGIGELPGPVSRSKVSSQVDLLRCMPAPPPIAKATATPSEEERGRRDLNVLICLWALGAQGSFVNVTWKTGAPGMTFAIPWGVVCSVPGLPTG